MRCAPLLLAAVIDCVLIFPEAALWAKIVHVQVLEGLSPIISEIITIFKLLSLFSI